MENLELRCDEAHCLSCPCFQVNHESQSKLLCEVHLTDFFHYEHPQTLDGQTFTDLQHKLYLIKTKIKAMRQNYLDISQKIIERVTCLTQERIAFLAKVEKNIDSIKNYMQRWTRLFRKVIQNIDEIASNQRNPNFDLSKILLSLNSFFYYGNLEKKLAFAEVQTISLGNPNKKNLNIDKRETFHIFKQKKSNELKPFDLIDYRILDNSTQAVQKARLLMNCSRINQKLVEYSKFVERMDSISYLMIIPSNTLIITLHNNYLLSCWSLKHFSLKSDLKLFEYTKSIKFVSLFAVQDKYLVLVFNSLILSVTLKDFQITKRFSTEFCNIQYSLLHLDAFLIVTTFQGKLRMFNLDTFDFQLIRTKEALDIHAPNGQGPLTCLVGVTNWVIAGGRDGNVKIWRVGEESIKSITAHSVEVKTLAMSQNQHFLATSGEDKKVILWIQDSFFNILWDKRITTKTVTYMCFSFDSSQILMKTSNQVVVYDIDTNKYTDLQKRDYSRIIGKFPGFAQFL